MIDGAVITVAELHARASMPLSFRVCGVVLRPLTVGHARLLTALGLWGAVSRADLVIVAAVCSGSSGDFVRAMGSRMFRFRLWWHAWRLGARWDWEKAAQCWADYVSFHTDQPAVVFKGGSELSHTPLSAAIRVRLCSGMGYRPETFDDVPYQQALLDYWSLAEAEGLVTMLNLSAGTIGQRTKQSKGGAA